MDKIFETSKVIPTVNIDKDDNNKNDDNSNNKVHARKNKTNVSLTVKNLPWIESVKKVNKAIGNSRIFGKQEDEVLFCISIDGSDDSEYAFQTIVDDYFVSNVKLLCVYIFNSKQDSHFNYKNRKTTIVDKYSMKMKSFLTKCHFIVEDRVNNNHFLEQTLMLAENYLANFFVMGYDGLKGPRGDLKELNIGLSYLLTSSKSPTIIIKEQTIREKKKDKALRFLIILDKFYSNSYRVFNWFLPMINCETDTVDFLEVYPELGSKDERDWKEMMESIAEKNGLASFSYDKVAYGKTGFGKYVIQLVNFGKTPYDYVIFYNIPSKHKLDIENSESMDIVISCKSNIGFVNN